MTQPTHPSVTDPVFSDNCEHPFGLSVVTLVMWSILRTTELGKMLTVPVDVGLGLWATKLGSQVPRVWSKSGIGGSGSRFQAALAI